MQSEPKKLYEALLWPALLIFLLMSLLIALHWYSSLDLEGFRLRSFSMTYLTLAMGTHALSLGVFILAWHWNLKLQKVTNLSFLQSTLMVALYAIGKYTPGKIWGMVARSLALDRISVQRSKVVQATMTEQLALLHSGFTVGSLAFLALNGYYGVLFFAIPSSILAIWWVSLGGDFILKLIKLIGSKKLEAGFFITPEFRKSYVTVFLLLAVMWVLVAVVLHFCIKSYSPLPGPSLFEVIVITVGAYFGGFAAFFSVAGLGIREGVLVAALSPYLGISTAVYISVIHRLITSAFDIALGMLALLLLKSRFAPAAQQHSDANANKSFKNDGTLQ